MVTVSVVAVTVSETLISFPKKEIVNSLDELIASASSQSSSNTYLYPQETLAPLTYNLIASESSSSPVRPEDAA